MNPLTNVKNITKLNEIELSKGTKKSWHDIYKDSAWIFVGGLAYGLTEGDILAVFSQYGEIVNINLVRDKKTGKTKGYCFLCYSNQKSTVLAVDNFNGIKLCSRTIRVDHVANYKPPKEDERDDEITKMLQTEGCAPKPVQLNEDDQKTEKKKKKKEKKGKKKKRKYVSSSGDEKDNSKKLKIKQEKWNPIYDAPKEAQHISKNHSHQSTSKTEKGELSSNPMRRQDDGLLKGVKEGYSRFTEKAKSTDQDHYNSQRYHHQRQSRSTSDSCSTSDDVEHKTSKSTYVLKSRNREYHSSSDTSPDGRKRVIKKGTKEDKYKMDDHHLESRRTTSSKHSKSCEK